MNMNSLAPARLPTAARLDPATRSLHLVDIENLLGSTTFSELDVARTAVSYARVADVVPPDLVVIASSHFAARASWFGWPNARRVVRSGPNGADLALIRIVETEGVAVRFARVVIASGDKIFAEAAAQLQGAGVTVSVVSRADALSRQLAFAVRDVRYLELETEIATDVARKEA